MLLEDIKLNMRTARASRASREHASESTESTVSAAVATAPKPTVSTSRTSTSEAADSTTSGSTISAVRSSAPWVELRAWMKKRPFVGAVLTMLAGVEMFFSGQLDVGNIHIQVGIEGLQSTIIPVVLVLVGLLSMLMPVHRIFYGVIGLAVSVYALIGLNLGGFIFGMLLGAVGGILVVSWMPKPSDAAAESAAVENAEAQESAARRTPRAAVTGTAEPRPLAHSR